MKLYASVASERAEKGQGGNEYLEITITGTQMYTDELIRLRLVPDAYGHAYISSVSGSHSLMRGLIAKIHERLAEDLETTRKGKK